MFSDPQHWIQWAVLYRLMGRETAQWLKLYLRFHTEIEITVLNNACQKSSYSLATWTSWAVLAKLSLPLSPSSLNYANDIFVPLLHFSSGFSLLCAHALSRFNCVQLFTIPWTVAHQAPLSMGILQARILEWVAMPCSRGSSQPRGQTWVSCLAGGVFTHWDTWEGSSLPHPWPYLEYLAVSWWMGSGTWKTGEGRAQGALRGREANVCPSPGAPCHSPMVDIQKVLWFG